VNNTQKANFLCIPFVTSAGQKYSLSGPHLPSAAPLFFEVNCISPAGQKDQQIFIVLMVKTTPPTPRHSHRSSSSCNYRPNLPTSNSAKSVQMQFVSKLTHSTHSSLRRKSPTQRRRHRANHHQKRSPKNRAPNATCNFLKDMSPNQSV